MAGEIKVITLYHCFLHVIAGSGRSFGCRATTSNDTLRAFLSHTHWHPPFPHLRPPSHTHADLSAKPSESGLVSTHLGHTKFGRIFRVCNPPSCDSELREPRDVVAEEREFIGTQLQSKLAGFVCVKRRDGPIGFHNIPDSSATRGYISLFTFFFFLAVANLAAACLEGALEGRPIAAAPGPCLLLPSSSVFLDGSHSAWNSNAKDLGTNSVPRTSDSVTGQQCFQGG